MANQIIATVRTSSKPTRETFWFVGQITQTTRTFVFIDFFFRAIKTRDYSPTRKKNNDNKKKSHSKSRSFQASQKG